MRHAARRLARAGAAALLAASASFALLHLAPGDPVSAALERPGTDAAARARLRALYGVDRPLGEQYLRWLAAAARGDLGWSLSQRRPVRAVLAEALPRSLLLGGAALAVALPAGVALGAYAAWRPRRRAARALHAAAVVLHAAPEFVLGVALVSVVALRFGLLPAGGYADPAAESLLSPAARLADRLRHLTLPAAALALGWTAVVARHQRAALRDVAAADFLRTARAKGLPEAAVLGRHALRATLAPTAALVGVSLPALAGGAVVVETLFAWPGVGLAAAQAVAARDYPLVAGVTVAGSAAVALGAAAADLVAAYVDPRGAPGASGRDA